MKTTDKESSKETALERDTVDSTTLMSVNESDKIMNKTLEKHEDHINKVYDRWLKNHPDAKQNEHEWYVKNFICDLLSYPVDGCEPKDVSKVEGKLDRKPIDRLTELSKEIDRTAKTANTVKAVAEIEEITRRTFTNTSTADGEGDN